MAKGGFDFKSARDKENALEALIKKTKDPKKKAELHRQELRLEAMLKRMSGH